jgi:antitoxin MazE
MQVCKWGNSLAIRLPASVVQALQLKEGDEIEVHVVGHRAFNVDRDRSRDRAIEDIASFRKTLPPDWKFGRDEANAR